MRQFWTMAVATFILLGFAAVVSASAIASSAHPDLRKQGRAMMVDAQYRLALALRR
ncbi:hypothetical protein Swit_4756 [Rhizorhabdus wittichii RW1]|uniref:Uncharacterized protein n=2 Tax=Rhizorhabdus wittichii TaxID=160791 RepID=A0A9J9HG02_RHIWR|nr:hypothetical protein [Rhizorhabdus wittichii]ABQ71093.1 hypothetical protein Swit_4756 [Rhizorhabdus wittichii RW1]QTH19396.1 hypothetical protein HRJ34_01140 [Rhizorhabdus wittichii]